MPAGDLVTADYHFELRSVLMGAGSLYELLPDGLTGFGVPSLKTADVSMLHADGSYAAPDYLDVRTIRIAVEISRSTGALAMQDFDALVAAWAPATTNVPLYFRLPYWGKKYVNGRPRGLTENLSLVGFGIIRAFGTFEALDPAIRT
ncbi:MAG: hypothetical protein M3Q68_08955 [Actinomycetota bacterium]|nr:hypothetical protein [Actinomycetota bacterium]